MKLMCITVTLLALLSNGLAFAADVTGIYEGTITSDSGLGFTGQTLRVEITYDDSTTGVTSTSSTAYTGLVTAARVSVGSHTWDYDGNGNSSVRLYNDRVIVFSIGTEDRVSFFNAGPFTGPDLGTGTIVSGPSFRMTLSDNQPNGAPDGLTVATSLPSDPFDPALFQDTSNLNNVLLFTWTVDDIELGDIYTLRVEDFSLVTETESVAVPLPWLSLATLGLGILLLGRKWLQHL
jgi:hypothetical protein